MQTKQVFDLNLIYYYCNVSEPVSALIFYIECMCGVALIFYIECMCGVRHMSV